MAIATVGSTVMAPTLMNDGAWTTSGGPGAFTNEKYIQMVRERVEITLYDDYSKVHATFVFKNHFSGDRTVTMAFPESSYNFDNPTIKGFKSTVDGKRVSVVHKRLRHTEDGSEGVYLKTVRFRKGESRTVTVSYRITNGVDTMGFAGTAYTLKTGATWAHVIEECKVVVDWSNLRKYSKPEVLATAWPDDPPNLPTKRIAAKRLEVQLLNFKPTFNIGIRMKHGFWNFSMNGTPIPVRAAQTPFSARREGSEILLPFHTIKFLFGAKGSGAEDWVEWANPISRHFGGKLELLWTRTLLLGNGKKITLRRPAVKRVFGFYVSENDLDASQYVYLRDVIEAIGGGYRFDAKTESVELTYPKNAKKPTRSEAHSYQERLRWLLTDDGRRLRLI